jgi:hypothetical protein
MTTVSSSRALAVLVGCSAIVVSGGVASADLVSYDKLAVVASSKAPAPIAFADLPATIPATEHVDGIFAALAPLPAHKPKEDPGYRYIGVFPSDAQARAYALDGSIKPSSVHEGQAAGACLSTGNALQPSMRLLVRTKPYEPPKPSAAQIAALKKENRLQPKAPVTKPTPPKDTIQRVRLEKLTRDGDTVTVDSTDALFDLQTLGTRLVSKTNTKLSRVTTGPSAIGVFAARDEKGETQFVVTSPELPPPPTESDRPAQIEALSRAAETLVAQMSSSTAASSGCGRVRFTLATKPGAGEMATVLATAFLPPSADPEDGPATNDSDGDGEPDEEGFVSQQAMRRGMRKQRARPVAVNVSLSQLATETSPLLSVTFGWAGKDQKLSF